MGRCWCAWEWRAVFPVQMLSNSCCPEEFDTWRASGRDEDIPRKGHGTGERRGQLCAWRTQSDHVAAPGFISSSDSLSFLEWLTLLLMLCAHLFLTPYWSPHPCRSIHSWALRQTTWLPCVCFSNNFPLYLKESIDTLATTYKSAHIFYLVLRLNLLPSWFHLVPLPWLTQPVITPSLFCLYPPPMVSLPHLQPRGQHESHSLDLSAATTSSTQLSFNSRYLSPLPVLGAKYLKFFLLWKLLRKGSLHFLA